MFTVPIQLLGGIIGFIGFVIKWNPDYSGGLCLTLCLPWIMFHSGVMIDMRDFVSNYKAIVFRAIVDNFVTLACISLGSYYLFPIIGIHSLAFTDHLIIGAVFMPSSSFLFNFPPLPFPFIELIDDHSIVFGEGALGIALSILLLKHVKNLDLLQLTIDSRLLFHLCGYVTYVLVASSMLGLLIGLLLSFVVFVAKLLVSKYINSGYHPMFFRGSTLVLFIPAYLIYILAEYLNLSGTLCVFFYGVAAANHILPKDPEDKVYWRDDIHRIFTVLKWVLLLWVGASATSVTMNKLRSLENRLGTVIGVSAVLIFTLVIGKLVSVYPLSRCHIEPKEIQKLATDPIFSNPWRLHDLCACWTVAKAITPNHKLNPLLFNRWGLGKIEPQVMIFANGKNAETYLLGSTIGSVLVPSMLSHVLAYDQFSKSDDIRLALVHICIVIVYLCTSTVFDEWDSWTHFNMVKAAKRNREAQKKQQ
ncbi:hypothetical protein QQ045_027443 [Rhodiola kirilowii]